MASMVWEHGPVEFVVNVATPRETIVPQQASVTEVGGLGANGLPHWMVWFAPQTITGGVVSWISMNWVQVVVLPQQSAITQCLMSTVKHGDAMLVTVGWAVMMIPAAGQHRSV